MNIIAWPYKAPSNIFLQKFASISKTISMNKHGEQGKERSTKKSEEGKQKPRTLSHFPMMLQNQ